MNRSFEFLIIGVGQGGCRIADTFRTLGYSNCLFFNTASVDLDGLDAPQEQKVLIGDHSDGAGKDMEVGAAAAIFSADIIESRIKDASDVDKIIVCVGSGGGTGSGAGYEVIKIAKKFSRVAVMATLPAKSELTSGKVAENARSFLIKMCDEVDAGEIFPLMVMDNQLIRRYAPIRSFRTMWYDANRYACNILDTFNRLSATPTFLNSVDKNDLKGIFDMPGTLFLGECVNAHPNDTQITGRTISNAFKEGVFVKSDSDVSTNDCACIVTLPSSMLDVGVGVFDKIMDGINSVISNVEGGNIHRGFYEDDNGGMMRIFSMSIGKKSPRNSIIERLT